MNRWRGVSTVHSTLHALRVGVRVKWIRVGGRWSSVHGSRRRVELWTTASHRLLIVILIGRRILPRRRVWTHGGLRTRSAGSLVVSVVTIGHILVRYEHSLLRRRSLLRLGRLDNVLLSGIVSRRTPIGVICIVYAICTQTGCRRRSRGAGGARWRRLVVVLVGALVE